MHVSKYRPCVQTELSKHQCKHSRLEIWQRGVDTDQFNPRFRCREQRSNMTNGNPDAPLLIHVGRLGAGASPPAHVQSCDIALSKQSAVFLRSCRGCLDKMSASLDHLGLRECWPDLRQAL
jgi:hypothetical protein